MNNSSRHIETDVEKMGGIPVFTGTRVPVQNLFDYLEAGDSLDRFLEHFPAVSREQAVGVLESSKISLFEEYEIVA